MGSPGEDIFSSRFKLNKMQDFLVIEPPRLETDKSYEQYENEVDAWSRITTIAKAKQGSLLMLSLPDSG